MSGDYTELKALAEAMKGWEPNGCWPAEDEPLNWQVGRLDEEGNRFPVMTVDTADYERPQDAKLVASYYAAASPLAVLALINECAGNARMMLTACAELGSIGEALGLGMDDDAEEMRGAIKEMRAELEKLREIPPCASDVYQHGQSVIVIGDVAKEVAERICRALSAVTGWRIDWHFIGGRAHFKALPPSDQHQGDPVAYQFRHKPKGGAWGQWRECNKATFEGLASRNFEGMQWEGRQLFTHADSGEVDRLTKQLEVANQAIAYTAQQSQEKQKVTDALMADAKQFRAECDTLRAQVAEQHQGEPVAPAFVMPSSENSYGFGYVDGTCIQSLRGYRDYLEDIVDAIPEGPLYTHADPGEVERLQLEIEKLRLSLTLNDDALLQDGFVRIENRSLRDRLAEQDKLLREIKTARDWNGSYWALGKRIDTALSTSADPSALPDPLRCNECTHADCGKFDGPHQVECRAMADNACARPGASS